MLVFLTRNGPPAAAYCPVFLCSTCQEPIQRVGGPGKLGGIVQWVNHDDNSQTVATTHKGRCDKLWTSGWTEREEVVYWEELDVFLGYLARNTTEPFPDEDNVEYVAPVPSTWRQGHYERGKS